MKHKGTHSFSQRTVASFHVRVCQQLPAELISHCIRYKCSNRNSSISRKKSWSL